MSCKCQQCGDSHKIDLNIPNDLWELIKPKNRVKGAGLLCGPCIMMKLENYFNENGVLHVSDYGIKGISNDEIRKLF